MSITFYITFFFLYFNTISQHRITKGQPAAAIISVFVSKASSVLSILISLSPLHL
jgi:hypothetical protein